MWFDFAHQPGGVGGEEDKQCPMPHAQFPSFYHEPPNAPPSA
jgi:hypothetical protein